MARNEEFYKCVLIGRYNAGKTSFLYRFKSANFRKIKKNQELEYASKKKTFGNTEKIMQIWDTLGLERTDSLSSKHFRGSRGVLLVYDITDKQSAVELLKWYDYSLKSLSSTPNVLYFVIGTKCDLTRDRTIVDLAKENFKNYDIEGFYEVSSETGEGFDECIEQIMKIVFEKTKGTLPRKILEEPEPQKKWWLKCF